MGVEGTPDRQPVLLTPAEVVRMLQLDAQELKRLREKNEGPTFHRLGGRLVRYDARGIPRRCLADSDLGD
jgi:hypothetical protein